MRPGSAPPVRWRFLLLALAGMAMVAALWGGLARMGVLGSVPRPTWGADHGPLMVGAFLGTVIGLERAVALGRLWTYLGPASTGLAGVLVLAGGPPLLAKALLLLGSLVLLAVFRQILALHSALHTWTMAGGALFWVVGNGLWLGGLPTARVVWWWVGFLVLTIAGERLELSRLLRLPPWARWTFAAAMGWMVLGTLAVTLELAGGGRAAGLGLVAVALWLLRYDIAWRRLGAGEPARFAALCLLGGYIWLLVGGVLALGYGIPGGGPLYDAVLHAVFVGFVFAMIFAHAPIILPGVVGIAVPFRPTSYLLLALLHLSLALRVAGDLGGAPGVRAWGGILNTLTLLLFMLHTAWAAQGNRGSVFR